MKNGLLADIWKLSDVAFLQYSALACCLQTTVEFLSLCACVPASLCLTRKLAPSSQYSATCLLA